MGYEPWYTTAKRSVVIMQLQWAGKAVSDLERLYEFLAVVNQNAAAQVVQSLVQAPETLLSNPRLGEQLFQFEPREVRRILVGDYEMRYELLGSVIYVLRVWHTKEKR